MVNVYRTWSFHAFRKLTIRSFPIQATYEHFSTDDVC
jgi:hypothetical protein